MSRTVVPHTRGSKGTPCVTRGRRGRQRRRDAKVRQLEHPIHQRASTAQRIRLADNKRSNVVGVHEVLCTISTRGVQGNPRSIIGEFQSISTLGREIEVAPSRSGTHLRPKTVTYVRPIPSRVVAALMLDISPDRVSLPRCNDTTTCSPSSIVPSLSFVEVPRHYSECLRPWDDRTPKGYSCRLVAHSTSTSLPSH